MTHLGETYALVDANNEIIDFRNDVDPEIPIKEGFRWLSIVDSVRPEYNVETQNITGPFYTVNQDNIIKFWNIVDKTPDELDSDKIAKILSINPNVLKVLLMYENKLRETPLTLEEYVVYLKDYF